MEGVTVEEEKNRGIEEERDRRRDRKIIDS